MPRAFVEFAIILVLSILDGADAVLTGMEHFLSFEWIPNGMISYS